jgi:hypothetical protein
VQIRKGRLTPTSQPPWCVLSTIQGEWRTVEGLAKETGLPTDNLRKILEDLNGEIVRSSIPDESGRALYIIRKHYRQTQGLETRILNALSDKVA